MSRSKMLIATGFVALLLFLKIGLQLCCYSRIVVTSQADNISFVNSFHNLIYPISIGQQRVTLFKHGFSGHQGLIICILHGGLKVFFEILCLTSSRSQREFLRFRLHDYGLIALNGENVDVCYIFFALCDFHPAINIVFNRRPVSIAHTRSLQWPSLYD